LLTYTHTRVAKVGKEHFTTTRTRAEQTNVVGDFHHRNGSSVERTTQLYQSITRRQRFKLVGRRFERQSSLATTTTSASEQASNTAHQLVDFGGKLFGESDARVEAGADGSAALSQLVHVVHRALDPIASQINH
jgi:hypothetical protein